MIATSLLALLPLLPVAPSAPVASPGNDDPLDSTFHYDYVDTGFALGDLDGVQFRGSRHVGGQWVVLGRVEYLSDDNGNVDVNLLLLSGGVGYVVPITDLEQPLDFIGSAEVEYGRAEVDTPGGSADDDDVGLRLRGGVRFQATPELEIAGGISLSTIFDEDLGLDLVALYSFKENLAGYVGFEDRDDTLLELGVRFSF
jgi:hypothetical protein